MTPTRAQPRIPCNRQHGIYFCEGRLVSVQAQRHCSVPAARPSDDHWVPSHVAHLGHVPPIFCTTAARNSQDRLLPNVRSFSVNSCKALVREKHWGNHLGDVITIWREDIQQNVVRCLACTR